MSYFVVGYQLNRTKNYPELWDEMERLDAHKAMNSFYLVDVNLSRAEQLRDHLKMFVDNDDMIFVAKFSERPAHKRCYRGTNDWIEARF